MFLMRFVLINQEVWHNFAPILYF